MEGAGAALGQRRNAILIANPSHLRARSHPVEVRIVSRARRYLFTGLASFVFLTALITGSASPVAPPNGQFWYLGTGNTADARVAYINATSCTNSDGATAVLLDNNPTVDLGTGCPENVAWGTPMNDSLATETYSPRKQL